LVVSATFAAALASKPMAVTLPFVLLLWDYWPLGRVRGGDSKSAMLPAYSWAQLVIEKIPLFAFSAASAAITVYAQRAGGAVRSIAQFSFGVRVENAICAYAMYLWKMVWPMRLALVYPHPGDLLAAWRVALSTLVLIGITAAVYRLRGRRYLAVGWLWFLGTLVPVIGLVQVGDAAMADRYAYIPLIGIFIMIAFGMADFAAARNIGVLWQAVPAITVTILLALLCHRQIGYWESSESVWAHALAVTQNNFIAEDNQGGALVMEGNADQAFPHFEAASRINPQDAMSRMNIGAYLQSHSHIDEAITQYKTAIGLTSDVGLRAQAYANLGGAQRALGEDEAARESFDEALLLNPNQASAWVGKGLLARKQGRLDEAIDDFSRGVAVQPTGEHYFDLGRSLQQAGRLPEAAGAYRRALKLSPNLTEAQQALDELSARQP
jgi:tetratricopeptide (TPR) repeat protein